MSISVTIQKTRRKLHRKVFEGIKESNMWIKYPRNISHELAITLFPVVIESENGKNENNLPQTYRGWIHSLMNTC